MIYRRFGRTGWQVSEIGYGMWGLAGWKGGEDKEYRQALDHSVELGCNFFDTAWGYGAGLSEQELGALLKRHTGKTLYAATKIPPLNLEWPSKREYTIKDCFPAHHIIEYTEKSLKNLGLECIPLQQFHVWEDHWAQNEEWQKAVEQLKAQGKVQHFGVSVNRWEPWNCLKTLETGLIDSVQVIYNIFDQAPKDELLPLCEKLDIAVIARVPFDEGTLTGTITKETTWPEGDWRNLYFVPENLVASVERADILKEIVPNGMDLAEMALRFILDNPLISTTIPGMRRISNVNKNMHASDHQKLNPELLQTLGTHRWDRQPTSWSM